MYRSKLISPKSLRDYESQIGKNTITHKQIRRMLSDGTNAYEKILNEGINEEALKRLANNRNGYVRAQVACMEKTPIETLLELAEDVSIFVRSKVAENYKTPLNVLLKFLEEDNLRSSVAINPNLPLEIIQKLSKDENAEVRYAIGINRSTSIAILEELAKDENKLVSNIATVKIKQKKSEE